jgi:hypothetical protein
MLLKSEFARLFINIIGHGSPAVLFLSCFVCIAVAQTQKPNLPDPVKFSNKFDMVANAVRATLKESYDIELDDRSAGRITTRTYEFITGTLTASEAEKVSINKNAATGHWLKARYSVEAILEIVSPTETLVTIRTNMEALNRDVDGTEKWLPLESLGIYERRILGKISALLMGKTTEKQKEGFWGQKPQPVDPRRSRFPTPP